MALFKKHTKEPEAPEWYYCLDHKTVEEGLQCPAKSRFGPYASRTEAEHAMEKVKERNEEWDEMDK
jgi:hypothetical protein